MRGRREEEEGRGGERKKGMSGEGGKEEEEEGKRSSVGVMKEGGTDERHDGTKMKGKRRWEEGRGVEEGGGGG